MGADLSSKVPVVLLTGFLGSGKTTLLRRILNHPGMAKTAVLINEFGEIGLDHLLVKAVHGDTIVLQNGCICCRLQADLRTGLRGLIDGRGKDDATGEFDRIVIETTGLADPAPILQALMAHPGLLGLFRLDGVIAMVDAVNGDATLDRHEEAVRQVAMADRIVLTKSDLGEAAAAPLRGRLERLNPGAPVIQGSADRPTAKELLDCGLYDPSGKLPDVALKNLRVVAFVQDDADKRILGAAEVAVAEPAP